ncbi:MAG: SAM-dependent methyltransferase, partial [Actinomycetota bacterium]|nr:SAM-dependent methyltransferase [Actinomycetota bacterium]
MRTIDNGNSDAYIGAVPAELVLMVGIFGNISTTDVRQTIATTPQFCEPGGTLVWSRGRKGGDRNDEARASSAAAGFTEL